MEGGADKTDKQGDSYLPLKTLFARGIKTVNKLECQKMQFCSQQAKMQFCSQQAIVCIHVH